MARRCGRCSRRWASGLTLVEAACAMALLGSLLVGILLAGARLARQQGRAERRIEAAGIADALLVGWWAKRDEFPRADAGAVPGRYGWRWRTQVVAGDDADAMNAEVVALEVFAPHATPEDAPAIRVEVLLPKEKRKSGDGDKPGGGASPEGEESEDNGERR